MDQMPQPSDHLKRLTDICRKAGLRVTPQRLRIFEEVVRSTDHPTAEELFYRMRNRQPTLSLDTVYRTLSALERAGVVVRLNIAQAATRFEGLLEPHHHFICQECASIDDIVWPEFDTMPLPKEAPAWGHVEKRHVELTGLCKHCLKKARGEGAGASGAANVGAVD
jgi:Fur family peroxide stress response transcriptional regulator